MGRAEGRQGRQERILMAVRSVIRAEKSCKALFLNQHREAVWELTPAGYQLAQYPIRDLGTEGGR
jgi:hypothetical protein